MLCENPKTNVAAINSWKSRGKFKNLFLVRVNHGYKTPKQTLETIPQLADRGFIPSAVRDCSTYKFQLYCVFEI